jgi:hypothetical protein
MSTRFGSRGQTVNRRRQLADGNGRWEKGNNLRFPTDRLGVLDADAFGRTPRANPHFSDSGSMQRGDEHVNEVVAVVEHHRYAHFNLSQVQPSDKAIVPFPAKARHTRASPSQVEVATLGA